VRESICRLLNGESAWTVCGEASVGKDAVAAAALLKPDVVVLGVGMPDMSGVQVANQIRAHLSTPIVFITTHDATALIRSASGVSAEGAERFMDAVRGVMPLPPRPAPKARERRIARERRRETRREPREGGALTPREREVLHLLAEGHTNKQIAARLTITPKTAETHRARINAKLNLRSVSDLVRYAIRNHIIEP
jgi:DNA-binding NarL/FixJ family response regulator